ncbi:HlyD family efflux transporter periplasmic adaptor subunit [Thalassotalea litorea]|uniref:HlyD family efflux transporter periplasmic adaptor subunit n=1 Tax=Thalassotalea litorea TaxID=2020715 RepID=A0A5R9IJ00_9GAMM|nr:HlyD family efflux transporter periplasmic adaptor subunit [Thalassotalea litorea]TLU61292.1 HlyD family efflux transporter periplasmic adaptor subunit [Thalassotalea litorea]
MRQTLVCIFAFFLIACEPRQSHVALGTLERDRIAHTATINEVLIDLPVAQGSLVAKGTVLAKLDDTAQKAEVARSHADVAEAMASLDKLRNGAREEEVAAASAKVAGTRAALVDSQANYLRAEELAAQNLMSKANLSRALAKRDSDQAALDSAEEELKELTNGSRPEDIQMAEAHLDAAKAALASQQKKLNDLTIRATRAGILDNLPWNLGERVTIGSPVAIVMAGDAPYARVYVPEPYRVKISVGDELTMHVDGLEKTLTGKVRWISYEPAFTPYYALNQDERARLMYLAEIQLSSDFQKLASGIPVQVDLP